MQMTRLELYERVCGRPLSKVAPELGITGTALAAICRKHQVPYPGSGYWTRKTLGLSVELVTLPEAPDEVIEIMPSVARSQAKRRVEGLPARKRKPVAKPPRPARHPLLVGVEEHYRETRAIGRDEFLRPYKRILPDVISSGATLTRALSLANDLYVALVERGCRVEIARAESGLQRIHVGEQEVERKDREHGQYSSSRIWTPDRPTICYIGTVPIALAITEMTQRVTMRYLNGEYHREDSKLVRSTKPWQLTHSWTTQQDLPCGRFRLVAYSPKQGVDWSLNWQETEQESLGSLIPQIIDVLGVSGDKLQRLMDAADAEAERQRKEREEQWQRYERKEDARRTAQALADSRQQLAQIIETWGQAMTIERFFKDAADRLETTDDERRQRLMERLALARAMIGTVDPLDFIEGWVAPEERYRSKFA